MSGLFKKKKEPFDREFLRGIVRRTLTGKGAAPAAVKVIKQPQKIPTEKSPEPLEQLKAVLEDGRPKESATSEVQEELVKPLSETYNKFHIPWDLPSRYKLARISLGFGETFPGFSPRRASKLRKITLSQKPEVLTCVGAYAIIKGDYKVGIALLTSAAQKKDEAAAKIAAYVASKIPEAWDILKDELERRKSERKRLFGFLGK